MNEFLIALEDRPGSLAECCVALGDAGINIVAGAGIASASAAAALVTEDSEGTALTLAQSTSCKRMLKACTSVIPQTDCSFIAENSRDGISIYALIYDRLAGG